jgi:acid phosphatase
VKRWPYAAVVCVLLLIAIRADIHSDGGVRLAVSAMPSPAHVVIVVEENHSSEAVMGNKSAPFMNTLAANGALMTQSFAVTHPSEPNYMALFSGSTFDLNSDACPVNAGAAPNLGSELLAAGYTFGGFSEDLPSVGATMCSAGKYARKHAPWVNFTNVPPGYSVPFTAFNARSDYSSLPTVSFVIPNLDNDMHDGTIAQADSWLATNLSAYANWAKANNSLLVVTWDEDDNGENNHIPTIFYGAQVQTGAYSEPVSHYNVLSTMEQMYGLNKTGLAANTPAIGDIWG